MLTKSRIVLALAAAAILASPAHAQIKLRYAHVGVANAPQTLYADEVAKLVKERTNGRIEIQVFPNSQLGGVGELVDGVKSGAISSAPSTVRSSSGVSSSVVSGMPHCSACMRVASEVGTAITSSPARTRPPSSSTKGRAVEPVPSPSRMPG